MRVWTHDRFTFPLPPGHRFPIAKYALLRERVSSWPDVTVLESEPVDWRALALVHAPELLERIRHGTMSVREQRALGLPWSAELVERGRRSVGGTVEAAREALQRGLGMNLGGGTHHAGRNFARGFCLFNDVAVALAVLRERHAVRRALIVDCDVHQGDGTADIFGGDEQTFTLSLHGARNYPFQRLPSSLDVELPSGMSDAEYLAVLRDALAEALSALGTPDVAFYLAGADPWHGDRLGRLALSKDGLRARDGYVLDTLRALDAPVCVVLAGGYADDVSDTVDINAATVAAVQARVDG